MKDFKSVYQDAYTEALVYCRKQTEPVLRMVLDFIEEGYPEMAAVVLRTHIETERILVEEILKQRTAQSAEDHNQTEHELHREDPTP